MLEKIKTALLIGVIMITVGCGNSPGTKAESTSAASSARTASSETAGTNADDWFTASETAKRMGVGLNLGNTMEAYDANGCEKSTYEWIPEVDGNKPQDYETCWGAEVTTQKIVDGIRDAGFGTVRIPVF